jgi:hypothetical protein
MSGVFRNIDPPPPHRPASVYPPPPNFWCGGRTQSLGGEVVGGSIVRKTPDTALYSIYVSTLWTAPISRPDMTQLASEQQQALQATL